MSVPRSLVKFKKNGVEYTSMSDRCNYTLHELTRAALRDVGKFVCREFRKRFYSTFKRKHYRVGKATQYWVRKNQKIPDLIVGLKPQGFYGGMQEFGTSKIPKYGLLTNSVKDNIGEIVKIESRYLSALEREAQALALISEDEYKGE